MGKQSPKKTSSKKKNTKNKKNSKFRTALISALIVLLLTSGIVALCIAIYIVSFTNGEIAIDLDSYRNNQNQTSIIYANNTSNEPVEIARLHGEENRIWVKLDEIPKEVQEAFIALEDKRFEKHSGVDWKRTISVVVKYRLKQGGSTITQQLIKNLTGEKQVTMSRKFNEILYALNLEKNYSKDAILEAYLNTIPLGSGCYGVQTAAQKYFGKDIKDLNAAEAAVLASITKAPTYYNPLINPDNNRKRQETCLENMYDQKYLSKEEYESALSYPLVFTNSENYVSTNSSKGTDNNLEIYGYYVDYIIDTVIEDLMAQYGYDSQEAWQMVYYGGLKIYSAVDTQVQSAMENVYENRITFPTESNRTETGENNTKKKVQSSMVVMDYQGRVVGIVGGAGPKIKNRSLNRAADSPRQPGSSIKPLSVYTPAMEKNLIYWSKLLEDYAIVLKGERWPQNYGGSLGAPGKYVTVQYAIAQSLNTTAARLVQAMSPRKCADALQNTFHITTLTTTGANNDYDYSPMAVGGMRKGLTALEMTAAYATFGNGGKYYKPYCYYKVTNNDGTITYLESKPQGEQVISSATADIMNELMRTVITSGTGRGYGVTGFTTFAKTGTTTNNYDRWMVGGTPHYVAAVWYGYDKNEEIKNVTGNPAGKIFTSVMNTIHKGLPSKSFVKSGETVQKAYCTVSGLLAGDRCAHTAMGWFNATHLPDVCTNCFGVTAEVTDESTQNPENNSSSDAQSTSSRSTTSFNMEDFFNGLFNR